MATNTADSANPTLSLTGLLDRDRLEGLGRRISDGSRAVEERIRANPATAMALSLALGAVLGWLVKRR